MDRSARNSVLIGAVVLLCTSLAPAGAAGRAGGSSDDTKTWEKVSPLLHHHAQQVVPPCVKDIAEPPPPLPHEPPGPVPVQLVSCAGLIDSGVDGQSLSVVIWLPQDATGPLPTLVLLHAWNSARGEWYSGVSSRKRPFLAQAFAARGYAVVTPSARGMGGSCNTPPNTGPHDTGGRPQLESPHGSGEDPTCRRGWSHVNDRKYETRDVQHLLGTLVDGGVADPGRLLAAGGSYGGSQTWLLATAGPWKTPAGRRVQLAAAAPLAGGASALNVFAPNGRASDDPDGPRSLDRPHGVPKLQNAGLLAQRAHFGFARLNDVDPSEHHSHALSWFAFWAGGEPFDTGAGHKLAKMLRERKSAYPLPQAYAAALRSGAARPVAVLAVQGWNDTVHTPLETLMMYRALKAVDSGYPMSMVLADVGHGGRVSASTAWYDRVIEFLDAHAFSGGARTTSEDIVSTSTQCPPLVHGASDKAETVTAADWDAIHPQSVTLSTDRELVTDWVPRSPLEELATDPGRPMSDIRGGIREIRGSRCMTQPAGTYDADDAITWSEAEGLPREGLTLLGMPTLTADYELAGDDATVVVKLWDVNHETKERTLVTRGVYRLALGGGDRPTGVLKTQLFGNHYRFLPGHSLQLDISQTDIPFLQPDRLPSSIRYTNIQLELPTP